MLDSSLDMSPSLKEGQTGLGKVLLENLSTLHADEPGSTTVEHSWRLEGISSSSFFVVIYLSLLHVETLNLHISN